MNLKTDIDQIISNFLIGELSDFENEKLQEWKSASPENAYQLEQLRNLWRERTIDRKAIHSSDLKRKIWHLGVDEELYIHKSKNHRFIQSILLRRIAALFVIFSIIGILYLIGRNIETNNKEENAHEYVQKSNPSGQKSKIFLSDGSVVWLNAKSTISYYKHFTDSSRNISLDGEAFFDVASDTLSPFIVNANGVNVEALGTQFNINTRIANDEVSIALIEGVVKVFTEKRKKAKDENMIYPGEGIIISAQHNSFSNFTFNPSDLYNPYSSWKDGIITFNGDSYKEFVSKIQLWYGIEIHAEGIPSSDWDIRGNFLNESLENIMIAISYNKDFTYKIDRKKLMLNFK